ncbi:MAG TPA: hypothetical protein V6D26_23950 [Stenomitos sp.]
MKYQFSSHVSVLEQSSSPSGDRLVQLWAKRYVPNLSMLRLETNPSAVSELAEVASPSGRARTVAKLERFLQNSFESAGIRTSSLSTYIPKIVNLAEARQLSPYVAHIYKKVLSIYLQQSPSLSSLLARPTAITTTSSIGTVNCSIALYQEWTKPMLEQLVTGLEPVLWHLRERLTQTPDPRTIGFISTHFHFSTNLLLEKLNPCEQVLLTPYFKFVEEQVCIPWQRVCQTAAQYPPNLPIIKIVDQLLPVTQEIAHLVYARVAQVYSDHRTRRGNLNELGVMSSAIRDLEMFQLYLWLCFLEKNMAPIEQELLPLCVMVFPNIGVTGELVRQMLRFLVNEIMARLEPTQTSLLFPYTQTLQEMFSNFDQKATEVSTHSHKFAGGSRRRQFVRVS